MKEEGQKAERQVVIWIVIRRKAEKGTKNCGNKR
jgi:hypothetical protein